MPSKVKYALYAASVPVAKNTYRVKAVVPLVVARDAKQARILAEYAVRVAGFTPHVHGTKVIPLPEVD